MVTTTEFLKKVKSATLLPTHQITYQNSDILDLANEEIDNYVVPLIMSLREEYFVKKTVIPIVKSTNTIDIPERAVGRTIRDISILRKDATRATGLPRLSISDTNTSSTIESTPQFHYFEDDKIKITPTPDASDGYIILYWEQRPSRLIEEIDSGTITYITDTTLTVQQNLNTDITIGVPVDVYKHKAGYNTLYIDNLVSNITTGLGPKTLTLTGFSASNPISGVVVGDRLAPSFQSDIIQLPDEAVALLVQCTALRLLQGSENERGYKICKDLVDRNTESLVKALTPRNEGQAVRIRINNPCYGPGKRTNLTGSSFSN